MLTYIQENVGSNRLEFTYSVISGWLFIKKMERGIHKPKLLHFDNLGTGRAVASGARI